MLSQEKGNQTTTQCLCLRGKAVYTHQHQEIEAARCSQVPLDNISAYRRDGTGREVARAVAYSETCDNKTNPPCIILSIKRKIDYTILFQRKNIWKMRTWET